MKTNIFKIAALMLVLVLAGGLFSCQKWIDKILKEEFGTWGIIECYMDEKLFFSRYGNKAIYNQVSSVLTIAGSDEAGSYISIKIVNPKEGRVSASVEYVKVITTVIDTIFSGSAAQARRNDQWSYSGIGDILITTFDLVDGSIDGTFKGEVLLYEKRAGRFIYEIEIPEQKVSALTSEIIFPEQKRYDKETNDSTMKITQGRFEFKRSLRIED